jgi:type 2 lantibiotic biosynthesis protein LanM
MTVESSAKGEVLAALAWRAQTLDEVLAEGSPRPRRPVETVPPAAEVVRSWKAAFAGGDDAAFRRRLRWDGTSEARVLGALSTHAAGPGHPEEPPAWVVELAGALEGPNGRGDRAVREGVPPRLARGWPEHLPPFAELWVPVVDLAAESVRERLGGEPSWVAPAGFASLERQLLLQLSSLAELVLFDRFAAFRERVTDKTRAEGRVAYAAFLAEMVRGGLERVLAAYPALARRLWRMASTWVESSAEMLGRLRHDLPAIAAVLCGGSRPGTVVEISPGLSDRHEGGRQVAALYFESGAAIVYKPRDVGVESAFQQLLRWLAASGMRFVPPPMRMLARAGYGWTELVAHTPLASHDALRDYYRRAGALVCLTHVLGGADLHMDNVVACPEGPVLVDGEALLQPPDLWRLLDEGGGRGSAWDHGGVLCTATGLVTFPVLDPRGEPYEIGGLSGAGGYLTDRAQRVWREVNTDAMRWEEVEARSPGMANLPLFDGDERLPYPFGGELAEGFEEAYRFLISHRGEMLREDGPLAPFAGQTSRVVLRPSSLYVRVLSRLALPRFQRRGLDAGVLIDSLNAVFRNARRRPTLWPLVAAERTALEGLDVPRYTIATDGTGVSGPGGVAIPSCLPGAGLVAAAERIRALDGSDLARQLRGLRRALGAAALRHTGASSASSAAAPIGAVLEGLAASTTGGMELLDVAKELAAGMASEIEAGAGGTAASRGIRRFYLYDGLAGPALFLTALSRLSGETVWADAASHAWQDISRRLAGPRRRAPRTEPVGACTGLGGLVYALAVAARLSGDAGLLDVGTSLAAGIGEAEIAADTRLDVEGGCAGAALGLLALYSCTGDRSVLARAVACADRLASLAVPRAGGLAWPGADGRCLAGFAHGASGIAFALARVSRAASRPDLGAVVEAAFVFERSLFLPERAEWAVASSSDGAAPVALTAWCHGAPGIALARLGALDVVADPAVRAELETALATTRRAKLSGLDHICCGNLSRIETLLKGAEVLEREELIRAARVRMASVLTRAAARGSFAVERVSGVARSGFFRGTAGVGYQLLRLIAPAALPSVPSFDPPRQSPLGEVRV